MHPQLAQNNFYGQTVKQHQAAGFRLSETHYSPGLKLSRHSHEAHILVSFFAAHTPKAMGRG